MDETMVFSIFVIGHNQVYAAYARAGQIQPEIEKIENLILCVAHIPDFKDRITNWNMNTPNLVDRTFISLVTALKAADKTRIRSVQTTVTMESYTGSVAVVPPVPPGFMSIEQITALGTSLANAIIAGQPAPTNQPWANRGGRGGQARGNGREAARGRGDAGRGGRGRGRGAQPVVLKYCHSHGWKHHLSSECYNPYNGHLFQDGVINTRYHETNPPSA